MSFPSLVPTFSEVTLKPVCVQGQEGPGKSLCLVLKFAVTLKTSLQNKARSKPGKNSLPKKKKRRGREEGEGEAEEEEEEDKRKKTAN